MSGCRQSSPVVRSSPVSSTPQTATTLAAAARLAGLTPPSIRLWIRKGWLSAEPPWTLEQLRAASDQSRQRPGSGSEAEHGTPTRWRGGCTCDACRDAHNEDTWSRRETARVLWWQSRTGPLLELLASGTPYGEALHELGLTAQAVTGHRRRDPGFAQALDEALMLGRDPDLSHGGSTAWRQGCRCPECREYHAASY